MLLIDEIDRADEEFEGYLLEFLSDFQVTIPELGTIRAATPPVVIITSNRTREVHDALKRRCVYCWIAYPGLREGTPHRLRRRCRARRRGSREQVTAFVQELRTAELYKPAGVSETLDWAAALVALDRSVLDAGRHRRDARHPAEESGRHPQRPRRANADAPRPRAHPRQRRATQ